jgi:D-3-phosphoglycerate dehydrogenase / 2-oxoglutarate reductase
VDIQAYLELQHPFHKSTGGYRMSKVFKVVVTDYEYESLQPELEELAELNIEFVTVQCKTEAEVIECTRDADAIINQYAPITKKVIENLQNCKVIARYGIGYDTIDVRAATEKGIVVSNVTDYCIDEVADHAFGLLINWARKITEVHTLVKSGVWDYKQITPVHKLSGTTIGLVGFGKIPQAVSKRAKAFGMNVITFDPFVSEEVLVQNHVESVNLDELCRRSDYVSIHAPLTESTCGMISDLQFKLMKHTAVIINTARGPVIDEQSLIAALEQKEIAGAALDVVEYEPIDQEHPFLQMNNVILTPHMAWYSEESEEELKRKVARNVACVLKGEKPLYQVN